MIIFNLIGHEEITDKAIGNTFSVSQKQIVIDNNKEVDYRQITNSAAHFDNCCFQEGINLINKEWDSIKKRKVIANDTLESLGRLLHTIQDFYAHSNWMELNINGDNIPVWNLDLNTLPVIIVSGTFSMSKPHKCKSDAPTHEDLNKDDGFTSKEGSKIISDGPHKGHKMYDISIETAINASKDQIDKFIEIVNYDPSIDIKIELNKKCFVSETKNPRDNLI